MRWRGFILALCVVLALSVAVDAAKIVQPGSSGITCTGCSNNRVIKSNGTNLANSSIADDGTTVSTTDSQSTVGSGAARPMQINVAVAPPAGTDGINANAGNLDLLVNGNVALRIQQFAVIVPSGVGTFLGNSLSIAGSDNTVQTMARMPLTFPMAALAATTTTQWGEQKVVKALTIENVVFNVGAFSCAVNPAISLFDCSATVGTCTPVSTLATSGTLTGIGSSDAATTPTANVAAGEYIAAEFTAGTCATFNGSVMAMARPQ